MDFKGAHVTTNSLVSSTHKESVVWVSTTQAIIAGDTTITAITVSTLSSAIRHEFLLLPVKQGNSYLFLWYKASIIPICFPRTIRKTKLIALHNSHHLSLSSAQILLSKQILQPFVMCEQLDSSPSR